MNQDPSRGKGVDQLHSVDRIRWTCWITRQRKNACRTQIDTIMSNLISACLVPETGLARQTGYRITAVLSEMGTSA